MQTVGQQRRSDLRPVTSKILVTIPPTEKVGGFWFCAVCKIQNAFYA